jgi:hypothetical protein
MRKSVPRRSRVVSTYPLPQWMEDDSGTHLAASDYEVFDATDDW